MSTDIEKAPAELQQIVEKADTGARKPVGFAGTLIFVVAVTWSLFQIWYASPLPFTLGVFILNDTEARSLHLAFAMFLAFLAWPALDRSPRDRVPLLDWVFAIAGAFAAGYFILYYAELATRPGTPITMDIVVSTVGLLLLLEATRRAVGWPMAALAVLFLLYSMFGNYLPELVAHKGASLNRLMSHMWLTTEGVFGIALGVSTGTIFVYVLFGSLLDRAGGGNYMMQVSFAMLGHLRGGPAKVAVVSSGLNGIISGSSVSNVVSGGIFTIPLMKKSGYGGVKAAAIETMSSVNGQIMPPVMGAAAFLMVEYVGIPYSEIVRHALLPAVLSYIGLFYIVHLEALKLGIRSVVRDQSRTMKMRVLRVGLGVSGTILVCIAIYYVLTGVQGLLGTNAAWGIIAVVAALYLISVREAARVPDLKHDIDIERPQPLDTWSTVRAGLHYLIPIGTLIWALMIEELSPSLSAFWAIVVQIALMLTQRPLVDILRRAEEPSVWMRGVNEVVLGLRDGARNMIGIGVATATAGIIVGGITLTGLGLRMTEFVEFVSQGNVVLMLLFVAFVCLVLGLGVPTTANYVLVATLMAPVIVELGARAGLVIPLIAVHLFVFYYGIMGDITPPVGLATFAAGAIAKEDPIAIGVQGALYALRTVILPFIWVFNPQLLLIDVNNAWEVVKVVVASTVAMLAFCALTMAWFRVRMRWWEMALMTIAVVLLFRPGLVMDRFSPEYREAPASQLMEYVQNAPDGASLIMRIQGMTIEGEDLTKTVAVNLGPAGDDARKRLSDSGLTITQLGAKLQIAAVRFGSRARKAGINQGFDIVGIELPTERPSKHWLYLPALALIGFVWWMQGRRMKAGLGGEAAGARA